MKSIANTISLMERSASMPRRSGCRTHHGTRLDEANKLHGTAATSARSVPQSAICSVTTISAR